jgi:hypothetical protein
MTETKPKVTLNPFITEMGRDLMETRTFADSLAEMDYWRTILVSLAFDHGYDFGPERADVADTNTYSRAEEVWRCYANAVQCKKAIQFINELLAQFPQH